MDELKRIFFMENSVPKQLFLNISRQDSDFLFIWWCFFFDAPFLEETAALEEIFLEEELGFNTFRMSSMTNIIGDFDEMEDLSGGSKVIRAFCPLGNLFGYTSDLRSMSQGRAASSMELFAYEEVPPNVAQEIIEKRNAK